MLKQVLLLSRLHCSLEVITTSIILGLLLLACVVHNTYQIQRCYFLHFWSRQNLACVVMFVWNTMSMMFVGLAEWNAYANDFRLDGWEYFLITWMVYIWSAMVWLAWRWAEIQGASKG